MGAEERRDRAEATGMCDSKRMVEEGERAEGRTVCGALRFGDAGNL